jgi:U3 small nucleolar RNA-associated protein 11
MSSFRKISKGRDHKERRQPEARRRLGLLEKHKDYILRARNYHKKEDVIKKLKEKAEEKNVEEYSTLMHSDKIVKGVHIRRRKGVQRTMQSMKVMKTQDLAYFTAKKKAEANRIEKLESSLQLLRDVSKDEWDDAEEKNAKHVVYLDDSKDVKSFTAKEYFATEEDLVRRPFNRIRSETLEKELIQSTSADPRDVLEVQQGTMKKYRELIARRKRMREVDQETDRLYIQKQLMGKGRRIKISDDPPVYKWKKERKG